MPIGGAGHNQSSGDSTAPRGERREGPRTPSAMPAIVSMLGSLTLVLGLFLGLVWLMRRGMPKGTRLVSNEVVEVLGRAPLAARQQMHVIRFGNRILLVAVSPTGAETLAEINEPAEVDRLAGICQQAHTHSATNAFKQIFRQFAERPDRAAKLGRTAAASQTSADAGTEGDDA